MNIDGRHRRTIRLLVVAGALLAVAAGGIAYASIPGDDGVINGCRQKSTGALRVIDSSASCNSSEVALNWNQRGPSDAYYDSNDYAHVGGADTTLVSVAVPAGSFTVSAKSHLYNAVENSFAICELRAGASVLDENTLRLIAPANDQVVPFLAAASLPAGGTIAPVCTGTGGTAGAREDTQAGATRGATLH
jgi:hypothetical protein